MDIAWSDSEKRDIGTCWVPRNGALLLPYAKFMLPTAVIQVRSGHHVQGDRGRNRERAVVATH